MHAAMPPCPLPLEKGNSLCWQFPYPLHSGMPAQESLCIKHSVTVDPAPVLGCASSGLVLAYTFVVDWRPAGCLSSYHGDAVPLENVCNVKLSACLCEDNFGLCLVQCLLLACL